MNGCVVHTWHQLGFMMIWSALVKTWTENNDIPGYHCTLLIIYHQSQESRTLFSQCCDVNANMAPTTSTENGKSKRNTKYFPYYPYAITTKQWTWRGIWIWILQENTMVTKKAIKLNLFQGGMGKILIVDLIIHKKGTSHSYCSHKNIMKIRHTHTFIRRLHLETNTFVPIRRLQVMTISRKTCQNNHKIQ
jgi:hypothetical protein